MPTLHVLPVADLIEHDDEGLGCVCGPDVEWVIGPDGSGGRLVTHHSLDGREIQEPE
jgi:hypothetical protein